MIKVKIMEAETLSCLENWINEFGVTHKIVNVTIATNRDLRNCACVMYEVAENE